MSAFEKALAQHRQWTLKPQCAEVRVFDDFLQHEFRAPAEQSEWEAKALRRIAGFAAAETRYYADLFSRLGLKPGAIESPGDLAKLPVLHKHDLLDSQAALTARRLPAGLRPAKTTRSSGTTGRRVSVLHSSNRDILFSALLHRSSRWGGLDPMGTRVDVRSIGALKRLPDGSADPDGLRVRDAGWLGLGDCFHTGTEYVFNVRYPMERQVEWLQEIRPDYAVSYPTVFEEWLLANEGAKPVSTLRGLIGIGAQMTPSLRRAMEKAYAAPVHQNYGLNEMGMAAVRCAHGRYHVNTELCLVEIVNADGRKCLPGEVGHLLVTGLANFCMPLLRYDTGDLAEGLFDTLCPCGSTLPSFGEIAGRFRHYAGLPSGTRERVRVVRETIEHMPPERLAFLRRYQLYQDRENRFALRLKTVSPIPDVFRDAVLSAWAAVPNATGTPLEIVSVDEIAPAPSGKLVDFLSEFFTDSSSPFEAKVEAPA